MSKLLNGFLRNTKIILTFVLAIFFINNAFAQNAEELFKTNCAVCHKTTQEKGIGPGLGDIDNKRSDEWLLKWIKNSKALIELGDIEANEIFEEYNKIPMPTFPELSDIQIQSIVDYLDSGEEAVAGIVSNQTSSAGNIVAGKYRNMIFWLILLFLTIVSLILYKRKGSHDSSALWEEFEEPHAIKNFAFHLFSYVVLAGVIIVGLVFGLKGGFSSLKQFLFGIFPFLSVAILLIGGLYRYGQKGYKVSSLSTQFLEGKQLFWGSQSFHWGLVVLFLGHLIALLFPSSVLAWNGSPLRLMILEVTGFAFGLSALLGVILLVKRRLSSRSLLVVANKMDMVVYTILLTQIISGLSVAYFTRWGSSWFASILTPYLKSIFTFSPDISAISEAPVLIQIHIISAFLLIAVIPFTRFMHFLVAPFDYSWRRYQQVIWNWNKDLIRGSEKHTYGKKPRNH